MGKHQMENGVFCFTPDPIRLGEFDLGGVLYHSNYFHIYEQSREALLRSQGLAYSELVTQGQHLAVVESHQRFHRPVEYGMEIQVTLFCDLLKRSSVRINYRWDTTHAELIHEAWTRHAFVKIQDGKFNISAFPAQLSQIFEAIKACGSK
jgi:acyl-CoA thioester hydrolase